MSCIPDAPVGTSGYKGFMARSGYLRGSGLILEEMPSRLSLRDYRDSPDENAALFHSIKTSAFEYTGLDNLTIDNPLLCYPFCKGI